MRNITRGASLGMSLLLFGCSGGDGGQVQVSMRLRAGSGARSDLINGPLRQGLVAQNSGTSLSSLKYFIKEIGICDEVNIQGTGFNTGAGCVTLYRGPANAQFDSAPKDPTTDFSNQADFARSAMSGYVDLMDPTARATLNSNVSISGDSRIDHSADAGPPGALTYRWGYLYWQYPIKLTAALNPPGTSTPALYTHDGPVNGVPEQGGHGGYRYRTTPSTTLTTAPAEEAVVLLPNGGSWFAFPSPFVISSADLQANTAYELDLTFDPDGIIQGYGTPGASNQPALGDGADNTIAVPLLDLSPVPHRATEHTQREVYRAAVSHGGAEYDVRIELYYVDADSSKTIYGVQCQNLMNSNTTQAIPESTKVAFVTVNENGSVDLLDYQHSPIVSGLQRQSSIGATTSAGFCVENFSQTAGHCDVSNSLTFTLASVDTVGN